MRGDQAVLHVAFGALYWIPPRLPVLTARLPIEPRLELDAAEPSFVTTATPNFSEAPSDLSLADPSSQYLMFSSTQIDPLMSKVLILEA